LPFIDPNCDPTSQICNLEFTATLNGFTGSKITAGTFSVGGSDTFDSVSGTISPAATPLPAALPLFATGIGGLGLLGWRRKRKAQAVT
jgi:hypothetical protein